jgi:hypothetical protein
LPPIPKDGQPADFRQPVDFPDIKIDAPQFAQKLPNMTDKQDLPMPPDVDAKGFEELLGNDPNWDDGFNELPGIQPIGPQTQNNTKQMPQGQMQVWQTNPWQKKAPVETPPWQSEQVKADPIFNAGAGISPKLGEEPWQEQPPWPDLKEPKQARPELMDKPPMPSIQPDLKLDKPPWQSAPELKLDKPPMPSIQPDIKPDKLPWQESPIKAEPKMERPAWQMSMAQPKTERPAWQGNVTQPDIDQGFVSYSRFQYVVETVNSLIKEAKLAEDTVLRLKEINEDKDEIVSTWQQALEDVEKQLADFDQTLFG